MFGWKKITEGRFASAKIVVLAALFSVIDIATKVYAKRLRRLSEARAFGLGWLDAVRVSGLAAIAGGATWITDLKNNIVLANGAQTIKPQTATATVTGAAIDLQDAEGSCFAFLMLGAVSGTGPTLDVKFQESDTSGGTYADITGATFAQQTASDKTLAANFKRAKRFVRAVGTIAGTTPSFALAVLVTSMKKAAG